MTEVAPHDLNKNQKFLRLTKKRWSACNLYIWHWQSKLLTYIIRQSTNILPTINGQHIHRVSGAISTEMSTITWQISRLIYRSICWQTYLSPYIGWVSVDMLTDISVDSRSICRPTYQLSVSQCQLNYTWSKMFILFFPSYTIDTCRVIIYTVHVTMDGHLVLKCHIWECFSHENLIIAWISLLHNFKFYKSPSQRAMRAKGRAMWVMRATVKILRIFICCNYVCMRTRTRPTEQDEYDRNIKLLQRLHKPLPKCVLNQPMRRKEQQNMMNKIVILNSCSGYTNHHQDVFWISQSEAKLKK